MSKTSRNMKNIERIKKNVNTSRNFNECQKCQNM